MSSDSDGPVPARAQPATATATPPPQPVVPADVAPAAGEGDPTPATARSLARLVDDGRVAEAWRRVVADGLADRPDDAELSLAAGRLLRHLAPRRARLLLRRAFRRSPDHPGLRLERLRDGVRRGWLWDALAAFAVEPEAPAPADDRTRARWLATHGGVHGHLRDLERAAELTGRAIALAPDDGWIRVEQAEWLFDARRLPAARAACEHALSLRAANVAAAQTLARVLDLQGHRDEALARLEATADATESFAPLYSIAALLLDAGRLDAADDAVEKALARLPDDLPETSWQDTLGLLRARIRIRQGRHDDALALLRAHRRPRPAPPGPPAPIDQLVARLEARPATPLRRVHAVPAIAQERGTCAPATVASITAFLGAPLHHDEVRDAVCYAGTPSHRERAWLAERAYVVRHFHPTWGVARALLDRGLPFALSIHDPDGAHAQAVVGYDEATGEVVIRDPMTSVLIEEDLDALLERRCYPPALGTLILPGDAAGEAKGRADGIDLPGEATLDRLQEARLAAEAHRVDDAWAILELIRPDLDALAARVADGARPAGDEPLADAIAWLALRIELAHRDGRPDAAVEAAADLRRLLPDSDAALLEEAAALTVADRRPEAIALLEDRIARDPTPHPRVPRILADLIRDRHPGRALQLARASVRRAPTIAEAFHILGHVHGSLQQPALALEADLVASRLRETDEHYADAAFDDARACGRTGDGIARLAHRAAELGDRNAAPAVTLARAHERLLDLDAAEAALAHQLGRRADDPVPIVELARVHVLAGRLEQAQPLLARSRGRADEVVWRRVAHLEADRAGRRRDVLDHAAAIVERRPRDWVAQDARLRAIGELSGIDALLDAADLLVATFPDEAEPLRIRYRWRQARSSVGARVELVRAIVAADPDDPWALRELALALRDESRADAPTDEALALLRRARTIAPREAASTGLLGDALADAGERVAAIALADETIRRDPAYGLGWDLRLRLCGDDEERVALARAELDRIAAAPVAGPELDSRLAASGLDATGRRRWLEERLAARPDDLVARFVLGSELIAEGDAAAALRSVDVTLARHPSSASAHAMRADVLASIGDDAGALEALDRVTALQPDRLPPRRKRARLLAERGDRDAALAEADAMIEADRLAAAAHGWAAEVAWGLDARGDALARLEACLELEPSSARARELLCEWATVETGSATSIARRIARRHPDLPGPSITLGEILLAADRAAEALAPFDDAAEAAADASGDPARDLAAVALCELDRAGEAVARLTAWTAAEPASTPLRGRLAWARRRAGDRDGAVAALRALVAEAPGYAWGLEQLLEWLDEDGDQAAIVEVGPLLIAAHPDTVTGRGYLADALLQTGGALDDAEALLREAIERAPDYQFARLRLADLLRDGDRPEEALAVLADEEGSGPTEPPIRLRRIRLLHGLEREDERRAELDELLAGPCASASAPAIARIIADVDRALHEAYVEAAVRLAGEGRIVPAHVGPAARAAATLGLRDSLAALEGAVIGGAVADDDGATLSQLALARADLGDADGLDDLVARAPELARKSAAWANVGLALFRQGREVTGVAWMADWRDRKLPDWAAWNLGVALLAVGRLDEARAVHDRGAERSDDAEDWAADHHAAAAMYATFAGETDAARAALDAMADAEASLDPAAVCFRQIARQLIRLDDLPPAQRPAADALTIEPVRAALTGDDTLPAAASQRAFAAYRERAIALLPGRLRRAWRRLTTTRLERVRAS